MPSEAGQVVGPLLRHRGNHAVAVGGGGGAGRDPKSGKAPPRQRERKINGGASMTLVLPLNLFANCSA